MNLDVCLLFLHVCVADEYVHLAVLAGAVPVLVRLLSRVAQINEPQLYEHEIARDCALALALIATKVSSSVKCFRAGY